jgi:2-dehydropantoate 2-reductase
MSLNRDYDYVQRYGLQVDSPTGNFVLPQVHVYRDVKDMPPCDVVIIALKTTHNAILPGLLPAVVKSDGVVLVLQNGLNVEPAVAEIVGSDRVMGGVCFLCANKLSPGYIVHLDYQLIALGDYRPDYTPAGRTERMQAIAQDFEQAGIPIDQSEDLLLIRWKKLIWNIPFNGLSVVLNAQTDAMMASSPICTLIQRLMQEVKMVAAAYGRYIDESFLTEMMEHTAKMTPYRTSMKIDYDEKRPLEIEAIVGQPLRAAQQKHIAVPAIQMLYEQLQFLNQMNRG